MRSAQRVDGWDPHHICIHKPVVAVSMEAINSGCKLSDSKKKADSTLESFTKILGLLRLQYYQSSQNAVFKLGKAKKEALECYGDIYIQKEKKEGM